MGRIEAVIFDWGGVLIDDPAPGRLRYCAEALGVSEGLLDPAIARFTPEFQIGAVGEDVFWERVCRELGIDAPQSGSLWGEGFDAGYVERAEMFDLAADLQRKGLKTAVLSNTEAPAVEYFRRMGYDMFDCLVFSCNEGARKPESSIFEIALKKLGSSPERAVFIDDDPKYVAAAKQAGLNTILFEGIDQVRDELSRLGVCLD